MPSDDLPDKSTGATLTYDVKQGSACPPDAKGLVAHPEIPEVEVQTYDIVARGTAALDAVIDTPAVKNAAASSK